VAKAKKMKIKSIKKPKSATIIYIFLIPMFVSTILELFSSHYISFLIKLVGFGMLLGSAKLIDKGLENEFNYNSKKLAIAPKIKYKLFGSIALSLSLLFIALSATHINIINAIFSSIIGGIGAYIYYGKDPSVDKLPEGDLNYKKIVESLQEAKDKLKDIEKNNNLIEDIEIKEAVNQTINRAYEILNTIEEDPKDLSVIRKFMVVYLDGVKDVVSQYQSVDKNLLDSSYKERLKELLEDASKRFEKELERLKSNEIFDLDVQIDALKEQLKN